jgi:glycosyltransferase involved in cell wall biosynthesis
MVSPAPRPNLDITEKIFLTPKTMSYKIVNVEVTQPLSEVKISEEETGIAVILRYQTRPICFFMKAMPAGSIVTSETLSTWISQEAGTKILQEKIRSEFAPPLNLDGFPSLTVAICTKDRPENVSRCLNSLLKVEKPTLKTPLNWEILVVDNAPSDERTKQLVESLPGIRYTREPKPGLDFARNHALQAATGQLLTFLDDDVVVDPYWLQGLIEVWAENPNAGAFTGQVLPFELETEAQILFESRGGFRHENNSFEKTRYGKILPGNPLYPCGAGIFGAGCNMTFRRDVLLRIGGFDDALDTGAPLPGGGDLDIFYRVIRAGYDLIYEPRYLVFHQHRREMEKLRHQYWTWGLGCMAFIVKSYQYDPSQRLKLIHFLWWWFKYELDLLKKSLFKQYSLPPLMVWAELWGGIVGLFGEYPRSQKRIEKIRQKFS